MKGAHYSGISAPRRLASVAIMKAMTPVIAAAILAGGQSRRMGQPKALLPLEGKPLVEHLIAALKRDVAQVFVTGCPESGLYRHLSVPVVTDLLADSSGGMGPLGGIYTALRYVSEQQAGIQAVLCVPCDGVKLPPHFVQRLVAALGRHELVYARDSEQDQQLYCLLRTSLQEPLLSYLNSGGRKVIDWFESRDYAVVDFSANNFSFHNLNTPDDWQRF
jgi:molybdopterin-guanine dinucleotide biosynthesis protein A